MAMSWKYTRGRFSVINTTSLSSPWAISSWKAFRSTNRVLKNAYCWNSGSASSNMMFLISCPRLRLMSTCALPNSFELGFSCAVDPDTFCTRFDNWNSTAPVSRRTAEFVGVVAVNWMRCNENNHFLIHF